MRYIVHERFIGVNGKPFRFYSDPDNLDFYTEPTFGGLLFAVLDQFNPSSQMGFVLSMAEIRKFNEMIALMEKEQPPYTVIEDAHWLVTKKVCEWILPLMGGGWMRNAPRVVDMLDALPKEEPVPQIEEPDTNHQDELPDPCDGAEVCLVTPLIPAPAE